MKLYGVTINPSTSAWLQTVRMHPGGVMAVRSIIYALDDAADILRYVPDFGRLTLMMNNECREVGGDWSGWEMALRELVARHGQDPRLYAVECGNELDIWWDRNPADVPPDFGAMLVEKAKPILTKGSIRTLLTSVAGEHWYDYMEQALQHCDPHGVAFHPYAQHPDGFNPNWGVGSLRLTLDQALSIAQRPVYITEVGIKIGEAGGDIGQVDYAEKLVKTVASYTEDQIPWMTYFALHDNVGAPSEQGQNAFGLIGADNFPRPALEAYIAQVESSLAEKPLPNPEPEPEPDPQPDPEPESDLGAQQNAFRDLWEAATNAYPPKVFYNPETAFAKYWRQHPEIGSPVGPERSDESGVFQAFVTGVYQWLGGDTVARVP